MEVGYIHTVGLTHWVCPTHTRLSSTHTHPSPSAWRRKIHLPKQRWVHHSAERRGSLNILYSVSYSTAAGFSFSVEYVEGWRDEGGRGDKVCAFVSLLSESSVCLITQEIHHRVEAHVNGKSRLVYKRLSQILPEILWHLNALYLQRWSVFSRGHFLPFEQLRSSQNL